VFGFTGGACVEPVVVREVRHILAEVNDSRRKERPDMILWWIGDLILLFVVLPIVVVLMNRIVAPVNRIRATVDDILHDGVVLTGELDNVPELLAVTDSAVKEISIGATRYVKRVGHLLNALGV
jgi:predicted nucleic acid-binding Zn ribbon protein